MATYSTGISVSWDGLAFSEVTGVSVQYGAARAGRVEPWVGDAGTATVQMLAGAMANQGYSGLRATLSIQGGGVSLTCPAIYETCAAQPELNGVTRYTVNFKLLDG